MTADARAGAAAEAAAPHDELMTLAARLTALGGRPAPPCPDPVNAAMIRNWTQAIGDTDTARAIMSPPPYVSGGPHERAGGARRELE